MRVSDPCYSKTTWCAGVLDVKVGQWHGSVAYSDEGKHGIRVSQLMVWHEELDIEEPGRDFPLCNELIDIECGVDSGQMSFWEEDKYPNDPGKDDTFYDMVCNWTLHTPSNQSLLDFGVYIPTGINADIDYDKLKEFIKERGFGSFGGNESGVVSCTGYGDGGYPCSVQRNEQGEIVAAKVDFIEEN